jgi:CDP-diglyceride synthetase
MEISLGGIIILVLVCALIIFIIDRLVANPRTKNIFYVVLAIIAILVLLQFAGVFGHLGSVHVNRPIN